MASKSGSKPRSLRSFPRRSNISLLQNYFIVTVMLKTMWGETEDLMLLFWSFLCDGGRVVRQRRCEGSEVGRCEGSEVEKVRKVGD